MADNVYSPAGQGWWGIGPIQHVKPDAPSFIEVILPFAGEGGGGSRSGYRARESGELG